MSMVQDLHVDRARYSRMRLDDLRSRVTTIPELTRIPQLTIFAAGSYARLEASPHSDIDLFFVNAGKQEELIEPRTNAMRIFGQMIDIIDQMQLPKFSNDCEYVHILHKDDIVVNLGSRLDDHENYFTARMLLLLESHCLYNAKDFDAITKDIVESYFTDYPDHKLTFYPTFLLNDICRFWKTLLLNYENKRAFRNTPEQDLKKTKHKVRNFKNKYSRMTTCFASIAALGSFGAPVTSGSVIELTKATPRERLLSVRERLPAAMGSVDDILERYNWFLEMTALTTEELEKHFADKQRRIEMFAKAQAFGDSMFALLRQIDELDPKSRLLRSLVI